MYKVTKTIYATELAAAHLTNTEYAIHEDTTLNEKFNVLNVGIDNKILPTVEYISIGLSPTVIDASIDIEAYRHVPTNACLFYHVPFVLKPINEDLSFIEQSKYRLRSEVEINGSKYIAYYLKKINLSNIERSTLYVTTEDGGMLVDNFISTNISPLAPKLQYKESIEEENIKYVVSSTQMNISFDVNELYEIRNACKIMYPDNPSIIGEVGLCSGVEGILGNRTEAGKVQLNFVAKTIINLDVTDDEVNTIDPKTLKIEIGGMEPVVVSS